MKIIPVIIFINVIISKLDLDFKYYSILNGNEKLTSFKVELIYN